MPNDKTPVESFEVPQNFLVRTKLLAKLMPEVSFSIVAEIMEAMTKENETSGLSPKYDFHELCMGYAQGLRDKKTKRN